MQLGPVPDNPEQDLTLETFPIYVGGRFVASGEPLNVVSPYGNNVSYCTYLAGHREYEVAVQAAQSVRVELQRLPVYERYGILRQVADSLLQQRERFATVMAREAAKPLAAGRLEVERAAQTFLVAAEEAKRLPGDYMSLDWSASGLGKEALIRYFPVGLVAGIAPFNFPLNLVAHKVAPAIAAGCPLILKPASKTPITSLLLAAVIDQTSLPKGALSIIPMDRESGDRLVTDDRFSLLSFTGSPSVGWAMKQRCGKKKVVLELGGNAGLIIAQDADMTRAIARSVIGAFGNAGQSCIHTQRIYVHHTRFAAFLHAFKAAAEDLVVGDPEDDATEVSALIDKTSAERIAAWVHEACVAGATVVTGGTLSGAVYAPTILTNTRPDMRVCSEEAFAPIVVVEPYEHFEQAVAAVNGSAYGLQAGIFTNDIHRIMHAYEHLHVGGVTVNEVPTFRAEHMPYGGVKDSGQGREGPRFAIVDMMEPRVLVLDRTLPEQGLG